MKRFFLIPLITLVLAVTGCLPTNETWHQKLSVVVETPDGEIIASSVMGIRVDDALGSIFDLGDLGALSFTEQGEAVVVDFGKGRYLFALLTGSPDGLQGQLREAYRDVYDVTASFKARKKRAWFAKWIRRVKKETGARVLPAHAYPMLVTFDDITDPTSVRQVDPADLAATFGEGYALTRMTLQVTDEPVTEGVIEGVLGWWQEYAENGYTMNGEKRSAYGVNDPLADLMTAGVFKTRGSK